MYSLGDYLSCLLSSSPEGRTRRKNQSLVPKCRQQLYHKLLQAWGWGEKIGLIAARISGAEDTCPPLGLVIEQMGGRCPGP